MTCKYACRAIDGFPFVCAVTRTNNVTMSAGNCFNVGHRQCFSYKNRSHGETRFGIPTDYTGLIPIKEVS